jgi:hypothetical protein
MKNNRMEQILKLEILRSASLDADKIWYSPPLRQKSAKE